MITRPFSPFHLRLGKGNYHINQKKKEGIAHAKKSPVSLFTLPPLSPDENRSPQHGFPNIHKQVWFPISSSKIRPHPASPQIKIPKHVRYGVQRPMNAPRYQQKIKKREMPMKNKI
jgi:hypothetical protein